MWRATFLLLAALSACAASWTVPNTTDITAECAFWRDHGTFSVAGDNYATFEVDCTSLSPSDVFVYANDSVVLHTDQKMTSLLTTVRMRDGAGVVFAISQVNVLGGFFPPYYMTYTITDGGGTELARCERVAVWATTMTFSHAGTDLARVHISGVDIIRGKLCMGARWHVECLPAASQRMCKAVLGLAVVTAVRDGNRNQKGAVSPSPCNAAYKAMVIGLPLLFVAILCAVVWYCRMRGPLRRPR